MNPGDIINSGSKYSPEALEFGGPCEFFGNPEMMILLDHSRGEVIIADEVFRSSSPDMLAAFEGVKNYYRLKGIKE